MKEHFTVIYRFMWEDLKLGGYTKEVFAVIFGFYSQDRRPVPIPIRVIRSITGASRSVAVSAVRTLEEKGLVVASHTQGRRTMYTISADVMDMYDRLADKRSETGTGIRRRPVLKQDGYQSENHTGTGPKTGPHNIKGKNINGRLHTDMHVSEYRPSTEIRTITRPVQKPDRS